MEDFQEILERPEGAQDLQEGRGVYEAFPGMLRIGCFLEGKSKHWVKCLQNLPEDILKEMLSEEDRWKWSKDQNNLFGL